MTIQIKRAAKSIANRTINGCAVAVRTWINAVPSNCVVCELPAVHDNLCSLCIKELPRLHSVCHRCALPLTTGTLCGPCLLRPPPWLAMICAVPYIEPYDKLMAGFKFQGRSEIAPALSGLLIDAIENRQITSAFEHLTMGRPCNSQTILVPVPLHWTRLWKRGFNQSALLAEPVGRRFNLPVVHALKRSRRTRAQTLTKTNSRSANLKGAFRVQCNVRGLHIILLDDVVTSGATALSATRTLLQAGARSVCVWACVRAKSRHPTQPK